MNSCEVAALKGDLEGVKRARLDGWEWDKEVCILAAEKGHLNILKWAHSNGCPWDKSLCNAAARNGHLAVLQWAWSAGCPREWEVCYQAAKGGHLEILKWVCSQDCPWEEGVCSKAECKGHAEIVQWQVERGVCDPIAADGDSDVTKWLRSKGCSCGGPDCIIAAAKGGHLVMVKWLHSQGCPLNLLTIQATLESGNLELLQWASSQGCHWSKLESHDPPTDSVAIAVAAKNGHFEMVKWLHSQGEPLDIISCYNAAASGHLEMLKWLRSQDCPWQEGVCEAAAGNGYLEILKWALSEGCPWDSRTTSAAAESGDLEVFQWARSRGCPWNPLWVCIAAADGGYANILEWALANGAPEAYKSFICKNLAEHGHLKTLMWARSESPPYPYPNNEEWLKERSKPGQSVSPNRVELLDQKEMDGPCARFSQINGPSFVFAAVRAAASASKDATGATAGTPDDGANGAAEGSGRGLGEGQAPKPARETRAAKRKRAMREVLGTVDTGAEANLEEGARGNVEEGSDALTAGMETAEDDGEWVEEIPVNSIVLAAKSSVLRTTLSNGMRESDKSAPVVIKVNLEEKEAFKEMLHFIYAGSLSAHLSQADASVQTLVNLLVVGDKFEVCSFSGAVLQVLSARDQTVEDSGVLALDIPEALELHSEVKAIVDGAKKHLLETFKDAEAWDESLELLQLREDAVKLLLRSDELEASSEDRIFFNVLTWVRNNHEDVQERQRAMRRFAGQIRFGCIDGYKLVRTISKLPEVAVGDVQELVTSAIHFQAYPDHEKTKIRHNLCIPRNGVLNQSIQIQGNFTLDESGSAKFSSGASWLGTRWHLNVSRKVKDDSSTVGIYLRPFQLEEGDEEMNPTQITFELFAQTWPSGYWSKLREEASYEFKQYGIGFGYEDALQLSWEEARKSDRLIGCTGELSLKVVVHRIKSKSSSPA